jgi:phosphonate transport system substrate-binding protein
MFQKLLKNLMLVGLLATIASCESQPTQISTDEPTAPPTGKALVIADVSNNPAKKIKRYQPMADYLAKNLSQFDIGIGEVKVAGDLETIASWLKSGEVDIYFDSPYPAMRVSQLSGGQAILRRWKDRTPDYYTIIFTMGDRDINSLEDLKGKTIAFDEPNSTSGYMLPAAYLIEAGLNPVEKNSAADTVGENEVGYVFSDDDENTIQWVISGKVAAGAIDIGTFEEIPPQSRAAMKVLAETEKVARHIVMVRPDMDPDMVAALKTILLEMDKTPEGKEVLDIFEDTAKFDEFPPEASFQRMRELYEQVENR